MPDEQKPKPFGKTLADLTPEEAKALSQGVDDIYFGGNQPGGLTPEQAEQRRKELEAERRKRESAGGPGGST
jgi:coproporphyrinogen III oxidase-like Fe-S oxidoreductase